MLLAVDIGVRTGLARLSPHGEVLWCRSHNLGNVTRLKRAVHAILTQETGLKWLALEGGGRLAEIWAHAGRARGLHVLQCHAQDWRADMLLPRQCRDGRQAKAAARRLAEAALARMGRPHRTALDSDAAEAVLLGIWAMRHLGIAPTEEKPMYFGKRHLETSIPCRNCGGHLTVQRLCREVRLVCPKCHKAFSLAEYYHVLDETVEEFLANTYADRI